MPMIKDPRWSAINFDGTPAIGARLFVYENGTSNIVTIYSDKNLQVKTTTPIIADGRGYFAPFYAPAGTYKVRIETAEGSLISETANVVVD